MPALPEPVERWHEIVARREPALLGDFLADDVVFRSPAMHASQEGRARATAYLSAALVVLGPTLTYHRQWWDEESAVLEFEAVLDGLTVHGIDLLQWGRDQRVTEFTVMIRPLRGLRSVVERMGAQLAAQ